MVIVGNQWFKFKQFNIRQDRCAMKVGTDGVILGAWASVPGHGRVLDVGTGTGLLSLMLAQRSKGIDILAVELDKGAAVQAAENVAKSKFRDRIVVHQGNFLDVVTGMDKAFNMVICNPPFFVDSYKPGIRQRSIARHVEELTFENLMAKAGLVLTREGVLSLIVPIGQEQKAVHIALQHGMHLTRALSVVPAPGKFAKRSCLEFAFARKETIRNELVIEQGGRHQYSEAYITLTGDFYLGF